MEKLLIIVNVMRENKDLTALSTLHFEDHLMDDLGFDSLDLAELTVRCEKEFSVDVFEQGIVTTVGEVLERIHG